ncbi:hypothetical protein Tco_1400492 [Tanacetum coccineum]
MVADLRYFNSLEQEVYSLKSQLETQKTQFLNEIDRLSRKYYYADHMNAILGVYTKLDEVTNLQCDYLEALEKCQKQIKNEKAWNQKESNSFRELNAKYFEIQDLKAQLQDKGIAISELKKLIEKMKGKSVETKFEKPSVIRQPNAFKSQRQSILAELLVESNYLRLIITLKRGFLMEVAQRISLIRFSAQSVGSSNTDVLDSPCLLVLITGTSQSVDTSLVHIESRKSPTAELFDVDYRRISIHQCEY